METKVCPKCKIEKPRNREFFYLSDKDGFQSQCIICQKARKPKILATEKPNEGIKKCTMCQQEKHVSEFNFAKHISSGLQSRCKKCQAKATACATYRLTVEQYEDLFKRSDNRCYICDSEETHKNGSGYVVLSIDHCHETNKVRGLLCHFCNTILGFFEKRKDKYIMPQFKQYLENPF